MLCSNSCNCCYFIVMTHKEVGLSLFLCLIVINTKLIITIITQYKNFPFKNNICF